MLDKRILLALGITLVIIIAVIVFMRIPQKKGQTNILRVGARQYEVEIVDTLVSQAKGLSGRESLGPSSGMLFVFKDASAQSFWMRGMLIPLDFVWINSGRVIGVTENVSATSRSLYGPPSPADRVLELNAGVVERDGIQIGDTVELK